VTYGPAGRIVASVLILIPILYAIFVNFFFVLAAAIWAIVIVPWAYRDIWRRVRFGEAPPSIVIPPESGPIPDGTSILDRKAPRRW
jgi:hypothetical protein